MAKKKKGAERGLLQRLASGGQNTRGRRRGSNRPRGEGRGLIGSVRALLGKK